MMWSTYSPEDNKLRLYTSMRLDAEEFARVKAAGFRWAPKQELFVAPMWTPGREDLLIELCGEVGDEDTSLVARAEVRADRFEDYSDSRAKDAQNAYNAAGAIAERFAGGQPILVGHHSEKRARKDKERIDGAMRTAVKMWDTSKYWTDRAAGAIRHAKYKERPDVRARRVKGLEADERKQKKNIQEAEMWLKLWTECSQEADADLQQKVALRIAGMCWLHLPLKEGDKEGWTHQPTAYDALTNAHPTLYAPRSLQEVVDVAFKSYPREIARCQRWLDHYQNRIAYERAMLQEAGGTISDQKGCEKGGAVRCWASPRGGWSYIQKVNKVSVTVLDNWGNGGASFRRNIELDKLLGVMTAAEVQAKRDAGLLVEYEQGLGFRLLDKASDTPPAPPVCDPAPAPVPELGENIDALRQTLKAGGVKVVAAPQLFPTPPDVAAQVVDLAEIREGNRVLEPSAGTGNLIRALREGAPSSSIMAVEVNYNLAGLLRSVFEVETHQADFLELTPAELGTFDRIVMNPPFAKGDDIKHISHALTFLRPGGRLVAICANGSRQNDKLKPLTLDGGSWDELPEGTFKEAGTGVRTVVLTVVLPVGDGETHPQAPESPEPAPECEEMALQTQAETADEPVFQNTESGPQYLLFL